MCSESGAPLYAILVDDAQGAEVLELGVIVGGKAEGVECVEPAVVGMAASGPGTFGDGEGRGGSECGSRCGGSDCCRHCAVEKASCDWAQ